MKIDNRITKAIITSTIASIIFVGCDTSVSSSSDSTTTSNTATVTTDTNTNDSTTGQLIDSPVEGADYDCSADGELNKITLQDGQFECKDMSKVEFRIGKLKIGEINGLPLDNKVFVPDLLGIERSESLQNDDVIALAKLLQSIDEDGNITNGIKIPEYVKDNIADYETVFNKDNLYDYLKRVSTPLDAIPSTLEVQEHLRESFRTNRVDIGQGDMGQGGVGLNKGNQSEGSFDINEYATTENLSQPLKDAIAYMGNEERLAYDVYMNLYDRYKDTLEETALYPLYSIAHKSESKHISTVQSIVQRYSITPDQLTNITTGVANSDATVETMPSGKYGIKAIQDLYNSLYAKGSKSARDALEVGCMVEVTDINDLNKYIELAQEDEAEDVKLAFENLRNGSYNHYWAFDTALKNIGVDDGCCVVGYSFCKTEDDYPKK